MTAADNEDSVPGQLDAIRRRLDNGEARFMKIEEGQAQLKTAMAENTEITKDIRDAVTAGRVATKVVKWVGGLAIAGSAIWASFYQLTHGGKLPHQ